LCPFLCWTGQAMEDKSSIEHSWVSFSHILHQVRASLWSLGRGSPCSDSLSQLVPIRNAARGSKKRGYGWVGGSQMRG
jgi:hypothetical protein